MNGKFGPDVALRRIARALGKHVGHRRLYSIRRAAAKTGIPERTLKSYLAGERMLPADRLLCLMAKLPPAFRLEVLALLGTSRVPGDLELLRKVTAVAAELAATVGNGRSHHRARAALRPAMNDLAAAAIAWAEGG